MAKVLKWGPSTGMFSTPLCVTPQISAKVAYLSMEPLTNFAKKLEFELNDKAISKLIGDLNGLKTGPSKAFVDIRDIVPAPVLDFLEEALRENKTVYVTIPLFASMHAHQVTARIFMTPPFTLMTTKYMFGSLYAGHFVTGTQIYDLLVDRCGCFVAIPAAFKLIIDGKQVAPCSLCKYKQGNANFCYLFNSNYSCLFHAGDIPELSTEVGNEQLAVLMNTPDIDIPAEVDDEKVREAMWIDSETEEVK